MVCNIIITIIIIHYILINSLCGYWDNHKDENGKNGGELFRTFEIQETVNEMSISLDEIIRNETVDAKKISPDEHSELDSKLDSKKIEKESYVDDSKKDINFYTYVLLSKLGTKAILLQIIPPLNILSLLLVSTGNKLSQSLLFIILSSLLSIVGYPLFVYDSHLQERLPPFFLYKFEDLKKYSLEFLEKEMNLTSADIETGHTYRLYFEMIRTFLLSRAINFFVGVTKIMIAATIAFSSDNENILIPFAFLFLLIIVPFCLATSLHVITVGKKLSQSLVSVITSSLLS